MKASMKAMKAMKQAKRRSRNLVVKKAVKVKVGAWISDLAAKKQIMVEIPCGKLDRIYVPHTRAELQAKIPPQVFGQVFGIRTKLHVVDGDVVLGPALSPSGLNLKGGVKQEIKTLKQLLQKEKKEVHLQAARISKLKVSNDKLTKDLRKMQKK